MHATFLPILFLLALPLKSAAWTLTINYVSYPPATYTGTGNSGCQNLTRHAAADTFTLEAEEPHRVYLYADDACTDIVAAGSLGTFDAYGEVVRRYLVYRWN